MLKYLWRYVFFQDLKNFMGNKTIPPFSNVPKIGRIKKPNRALHQVYPDQRWFLIGHRCQKSHFASFLHLAKHEDLLCRMVFFIYMVRVEKLGNSGMKSWSITIRLFTGEMYVMCHSGVISTLKHLIKGVISGN